jgi:hypothetical protein
MEACCDEALSCRDVEHIIAEMANGKSFDDATTAILDDADENLTRPLRNPEMIRHR